MLNSPHLNFSNNNHSFQLAKKDVRNLSARTKRSRQAWLNLPAILSFYDCKKGYRPIKPVSFVGKTVSVEREDLHSAFQYPFNGVAANCRARLTGSGKTGGSTRWTAAAFTRQADTVWSAHEPFDLCVAAFGACRLIFVTCKYDDFKTMFTTFTLIFIDGHTILHNCVRYRNVFIIIPFRAKIFK